MDFTFIPIESTFIYVLPLLQSEINTFDSFSKIILRQMYTFFFSLFIFTSC